MDGYDQYKLYTCLWFSNNVKKIELGESQTQIAWIMTKNCKEWFSRECKSTVSSKNDQLFTSMEASKNQI